MEILSDIDYTRQKQFMVLYKPAHERLCRFVQSQVWNKEDARDLISETVAIAYERYNPTFEGATFPFFLFGIASRLVKSRIRKKKFIGFFHSDEVELKVIHGDAEENLMKKELYKALNQLNEKQREAITLFELTGFSIKEIASITGQGESAVKSQLSRGRERLAQLLKDPPAMVKEGVGLENERRLYER